MDGSRTTAHEGRPAITSFENKPGIEGRGEGVNSGKELQRYLTTVITQFKAQDCHHRILFGTPFRRAILIRRKGHLRVQHQFLPGARFVLDLWRRNTYGTLQWRCFVCEAVAPGEVAARVPQVIPGARVLLDSQGAGESKVFLSWLYDLSHRGVDVLELPREAFEAAHFRLKGSRVQGLKVKTLSGVF